MRSFALCNLMATTIVASTIFCAAQPASATTLSALQVTDPHSGALVLDSTAGSVTIENVIIKNPNTETVDLDLSAKASPDGGNTTELASASLIPDTGGVDPPCGATLAAGASCEVDLVLTVTKNTAAMGHHGDNATTITADGTDTVNDKALTDKTTSSFDTEVYNEGPVPETPEPGSLILLGSGMLSLAGLARRKFRRH